MHLFISSKATFLSTYFTVTNKEIICLLEHTCHSSFSFRFVYHTQQQAHSHGMAIRRTANEEEKIQMLDEARQAGSTRFVSFPKSTVMEMAKESKIFSEENFVMMNLMARQITLKVTLSSSQKRTANKQILGLATTTCYLLLRLSKTLLFLFIIELSYARKEFQRQGEHLC